MRRGSRFAGRGARHAVALAAWALLAASPPPEARAADSAPPLVLEATIPLPDVSGRIDHMAVDLGRKRLIVAELGNDTVDVVDLAASQTVHRLAGLKAPQGVGYVAALDLIVVASADDGTVRLFNAGDFSPAGAVALGEDADNVRVDPASGRVVVGYGNGGLAVIDAAASTVATIPLAAHPEGFQLDPRDGTIFVNVPEARHIAVVDVAASRPAALWKTPDLGGNFPLAIAADGAVVASVFRSPARLVLFAPPTGGIVAGIATCGDADDVFFDTARQRIYVSCGSGEIDVLQQQRPALARIARLPTAPGARTSLFVPELDRLYVAARAGPDSSTAAILVLRPQP